ncbi:hypothetical protein JHJ32_07685 [Parapedobacter sp. ISTM3]|uniref:hypothetical protein n=1 Tax=Parapedobacter sp. ISTM3 TaxID=2800130 RepID=UPI0019086E04|nr:hypothetical protein [Parapedobacter sp. ISTM3]MBK1439859.1 hypothetical protein [Parapedobacter sp. ISTM3]
MDIEKVHRELTVYLNRIGFTGEKLTRELLDRIKHNYDGFAVLHESGYGEERMRYELVFTKDAAHGYALMNIKATHTDPIVITHRIVDGIYTASLEKRIAQVDWRNWFAEHPDERSWKSDRAAHRVLMDFLKLSAGGSFEGMEIQEQLQFKYFADTGYNPFNLERIRQRYESGGEYRPDDPFPWTANLIFCHISGRLDYLAEQFIDMGINPYEQLIKDLSRSLEEFTFTFREPRDEGIMELRVDIGLDGSGFPHTANEYTITRFRYPQYIHGVYAGIDTAELEREIIQARPPLLWDRALPYGFFPPQGLTETETGLLRKIEALAAQEDSNAKKAALKMMQRYFPEEPLHPGLAALHLPKDGYSQVFSTEDMDVDKAWNQLCGRAIWLGDRENRGERRWTRADYSGDTVKGTDIEGMTHDETLRMLRGLPLDMPDGNLRDLCAYICEGGRARIQLSNGRDMYIEANPEKWRLNYYDTDLRPLYGILPGIGSSKSEIVHDPAQANCVQSGARKNPQTEKKHANTLRKPKGRGI